MKSEETKGIVQQWFLPIALIVGVLLTYNDVISEISAKLNAPQIQAENKIKNIDFEEDIQGPIERAKNLKGLKKICSDALTNALNQAQELTQLLEAENKIHDVKWRIQTEARWRRDMLEYLEEETVAAIEVAWKTDELCRLEEHINHETKTTTAIAKFQQLVVERGLKEEHLRRFQSQLRTELEEATENFNTWNEKRLMHLAKYKFDVIYERSPWAWMTKGPVGSFFGGMFSGVSAPVSSVKKHMKSLSGHVKSLSGKVSDTAKNFSSEVGEAIDEAKDLAAEHKKEAAQTKEKAAAEVQEKKTAVPVVVPPAAPSSAQSQPQPQKYPETRATQSLFQGERVPRVP